MTRKNNKVKIIKKLLDCPKYSLHLAICMLERLKAERNHSQKIVSEIIQFLRLEIVHFTKITFGRFKFALKKAYEIKNGLSNHQPLGYSER